MKPLLALVVIALACAPALADDGSPAAATATAAGAIPGGDDQAPVAVVGGQPISRGEFKEYVLQTLAAQGPESIDNVLQTMINERLVRALAKKMGISVTPAEVQAWIDQRLKDIAASPDPEYHQVDPAEFRKHYEPYAEFGALLEKVVKARRTSDAGLRHEYDVRYGEKRMARHILFQTKSESGKATAESIAAAKKRADQTYDDLQHGADFGELAKRLSEDPGSRMNGGELPEFGREDMVPEFADIAFKLKEGEISRPVLSQFGWHIIQVTKIIPPAKPWGDDVKAELRAEAAQRPLDPQEVQRLFKELA
ncbi:MAG: peptidylprolyl isomerase, partial [Polyangiaceae bacterium]